LIDLGFNALRLIWGVDDEIKVLNLTKLNEKNVYMSFKNCPNQGILKKVLEPSAKRLLMHSELKITLLLTQNQQFNCKS